MRVLELLATAFALYFLQVVILSNNLFDRIWSLAWASLLLLIYALPTNRNSFPLIVLALLDVMLLVVLSPLQLLFVRHKAIDLEFERLEIIFPISEDDEGDQISQSPISADIVAVHGLGSDPKSAWKYGGCDWLREFLPKEKLCTRIMAFNHNTSWETHALSKSLYDHGSDLLRALQRARQTEEEKNRPIIFIGHSFGGLIIKQALVNAGQGGPEDDDHKIRQLTQGFIFLGTPHKGSKMTFIGKMVSLLGHWKGSDTRLLDIVEHGSDVNRTLHRDFMTFLRGHCGTANTVCVFEAVKESLYGLPITHVVERDSAVIDGSREIGSETQHRGLQRFRSQKDVNYLNILDWIQKWEGKHKNAVQNKMDRDTSEILRKLDVTDPSAVKSQIVAREGLLQGTGIWIHKHLSAQISNATAAQPNPQDASSIFTKWWKEPQSTTLWVDGGPGKGKTMLAVSLIDEIQSHATDGMLVAYFFCASAEEKRNNAAYIVQALLWQILHQQPSLATHLRQAYDTQEKSMLSISADGLSILLGILERTIKDKKFRGAYIVIDALDECDETSLTTFLHNLDAYNNSEPFTNGNRRNKIKWLFTSRNEAIIREHLFGALRISLEDNLEYLDEAVYQFVHEKVELLARVKRYDTQLRALVKRHLLGRADRTFLWVALAYKELRDPNLATIDTEMRLRELPAGLVPLYIRILGRALQNLRPEMVREIISAVLLAIRPLTLLELAVAANLPERWCQDESIIMDCVRRCGSFLDIRGNKVSLIHQSARDYLAPKYCPGAGYCRTSGDHTVQMYCHDANACSCSDRCLTPDSYPNSSFFPIDNAKSHSVMAQRCLDYLAGDVFSQNDSNSEEPFARFPFAEYAILFWVAHCRNSSQEIEEVIKGSSIKLIFSQEPEKGKGWLKNYSRLTHSYIFPDGRGDFCALHVATSTGLAQFVNVVLDEWLVDVNTATNGDTALQWAIWNGHETIVRLLLSKGASPYVQDKYGETPLARAVKSGNDTVVELLLRNESVDPNSRDICGRTPLYLAAERGHSAIVRLLLQKNGVDPDSRDIYGRTPLALAAQRGHSAVVELLLEKDGVDINSRDVYGRVILSLAVENGHEGVVQILVRNDGIDLNSKDKYGRTALSVAVEKGYVAIVTLLLEKDGVDPKIRDIWGRLPLSHLDIAA